jgi:hydrogenase-4 component B
MSRLLLAPVCLLGLFGLLAFVFNRRRVLVEVFGAWGSCLASLLGLGLTAAILVRGDQPALALAWNPGLGASFSVGMDMLSGLFLLPIYALGAACAAFGAGYMRREQYHRSPGSSWLFYALLVASMALVVLSRNAMLFLVAWELMSLSSYFLVTTEHEKESVRTSGITYLVATQIGTAFSAGRLPALPFFSRSWASAQRRGSSRCTSGFPRRTRQPRRTCPPS